MESIQVIAIRVCGAATGVSLLVAFAGFIARYFDSWRVPHLGMTGGAAFIVALTAFIVANVSQATTARSVCAGSAAVIAVGAALRILAASASGSSISVVDVLLTVATFALLLPLYRRVWGRASTSLAS